MTKVQFEVNQSQSVVSNELAYECLKINFTIGPSLECSNLQEGE